MNIGFKFSLVGVAVVLALIAVSGQAWKAHVQAAASPSIQSLTGQTWESQQRPCRDGFWDLKAEDWKRGIGATFQHSEDWESCIWLRIPLKFENEDAAISISSPMEFVSAYNSSGRLLSTNRLEPVQEPKQDLGLAWWTFPLPLAPDDNLLYFRVRSSHNRIGLGPDIWLGPLPKIQLEVLTKEFGVLVASLGTLGMGLVLLVLWVSNTAKKSSVQKMIVHLGLFALDVATYQFSRTKFTQVLWNSPDFWRFLEFLSLYMAPFLGSHYFRTVFPNTKAKIIYFFDAYFLGLVLVALSCHLAWGLSLHRWLGLSQISLAIFLGTYTALTFWHMLIGEKEARILGVGFFGFTILSLIEILRVRGIIPMEGSILHWGIFMLICSLSALAVVKYMAVHDEIMFLHDNIKAQEAAAEQKRLASLAHFSLFIGDRINNPLAIILQAAEDIEIARPEDLQDVQKDGRLILEAVDKITFELKKLERYRKYAQGSGVLPEDFEHAPEAPDVPDEPEKSA